MNNLNLIIGDDKKTIDFYLQDIINKINNDNKIYYDLGTSPFSLILDEASMLGLLSNIKIIIGTNFDISKLSEGEIEYLKKYIDNINKDVYIILIASKIDARVKNYKIFKDNFNVINISKVDNNAMIIDYVTKTIKDKGYKISSLDLEYFINKVGYDIVNINQELNKLFLYKDKDKIICREDIDLLIIDNIDTVIYEFTNAVLEKDIEKITLMYNNFKKENMSYDYLIASLANVFRQAYIIKVLYNDNKSNLEISKIIGKKEFYVKKMIERLHIYSEEDLSDLIISLANIELEYKSGKSNIDNLELFILKKSLI